MEYANVSGIVRIRLSIPTDVPNSHNGVRTCVSIELDNGDRPFTEHASRSTLNIPTIKNAGVHGLIRTIPILRI